ncbi:MAG TPA: hypothetical protein VGB22_07415 [candidate division Zixibacteria bacterium]|jgi:hypothetical protein
MHETSTPKQITLRATYWEARAAEAAFLKLRKLAVEYWDLQHLGESARLADVRTAINRILPEVKLHATTFGVQTGVGGATASGAVDPLDSIVEEDTGRRTVSRPRILDTIDMYTGAARTFKALAFKRLVRPWNWIVDIPAFVIRIPFLILERAGFPTSIEEHIASKVAKVLAVIVLIALVTYFGLIPIVRAISGVLK